MTNYYTDFAAEFPLHTPENVAKALQIKEALAEEFAEQCWPLFEMTVNADKNSLFFTGDGDPEHVIIFIERLAKALNLSGKWGFEWSHGCDKARTDAFGGGAVVIDLATGVASETIHTSVWLEERTGAPSQPAIVTQQ